MTRAKGRAQAKQQDDNGFRVCIDCGATSPERGNGGAWMAEHEIVCPTPGDFQKWLNDPVKMAEYHAAINMTYAEMAKKYGTRDMLIYEMYNLSQFSDGSVLNAITMLTYTAEQVRDSYKTGMPDYKIIDGLLGFPDAATGMTKLIKSIYDDLRRNARAAIKTGGHTKNLAPRVK